MSQPTHATATPKTSPDKRGGRLTPHALACVALLTLLGFSLGCSEFVVIGIETELAEAFGVSLARVGELISFFSITYAVCTPVLAITTGRFKRYQLLVAYAAVFIASNVAMAFAPTFELLLASRVLLGAVSGALLAVGVTFIPELVGVEKTSMMISIVYAAFSVAMVISTSAGKMIAETMDWHLAMVGVLAMAVITSLALLAVLPRTGSTDEPATMREQAVLFLEPQILTGMATFIFAFTNEELFL